MRKKIRRLRIVLLILFLVQYSFGQFQFTPLTTLNFGRTDPTIQGIGIGLFPPLTATSSRFHINNFLCNQPNGPLNGLLFRTDGNNNTVNQWQLFTGATTGSATEKYRLSVPVGSSDVFLNAVQTNGNMQLQTGSFTRLFIDNSVAVTAGFVGIGQNFTAPKNLLHIHDGSNSYLQVTNGTTSNTATDGAKFGLLGNTVNGIVASQEPTGNLYFATAGSSLGQVRMIILPNGNVGIGNGPTFIAGINNKLDVDQGDIDVNTAQRSYMIADSSVLWNKGNTSNIFVGVGAGTNHGFNQPSENTYVGYKSGFMGNGCFFMACAPFTNTRNTLIGAYAGFNNNASGAVSIGYSAGFTHNGTATDNTFVGYKSGFLTQGISNDNAFFGGKSGENNTTGDFNTFLGNVAGQNSTTGVHNSFVGNGCGQNNGIHFNNSYIGYLAGNFSRGDENVFAGTFTGLGGVGNKNVVLGNNSMNTDTLSNENVTIGYNAAPTGNNRNFNVIIGARSVPVLDSCNLNVFIGYKTAFNQTRGKSNVYLGESTGNGVLTGTNNTFIGAKSDATNMGSTLRNAAAIGANTKVTNSNHMILGDDSVNVGIGLSADASGPQKKLEINDGIVANPSLANPSIPGTFGASGLRFRQLTAITPTVSNPGLGVLTVDSLGNVIYVRDTLIGGGTGFGNLCGAISNPIPGNFEIPLGNSPTAFNYYFTGQNLVNNKVSVGFPCNTVLRGRFNSLQKFPTTHAQETISGYFLNSDINGDPFDTLVGVFGEANGIQPFVDNTNIGGSFYGRHARTNIGVQGIGDNTLAQPIAATSCYGGRFIGSNSTGTNYGVWATATGSGAKWAGFFQGDVKITSQLDVNGTIYTSDQMFKTNIDTISNITSIIKQLKPKTFYFDTTNTYDLTFSGKRQYGFIAQDVETVLPELVTTVIQPASVTTPSVAYKSLNYNAFIALLIKTTQVQQKAIDSLTTKTSKQDSINSAVQAQITALTSSVTSCCSSSAIRTTKINESNQLDIKLTDKDIIVLNQNVPNPFAEQTTITYNVPEKYNFAQIIFSTIEGKIIKAVDITKKGKGQLNVFANDLSTGFYTYTLIVDGKTIDTKKMVKSE